MITSETNADRYAMIRSPPVISASVRSLLLEKRFNTTIHGGSSANDTYILIQYGVAHGHQSPLHGVPLFHGYRCSAAPYAGSGHFFTKNLHGIPLSTKNTWYNANIVTVAFINWNCVTRPIHLQNIILLKIPFCSVRLHDFLEVLAALAFKFDREDSPLPLQETTTASRGT